MKWKFEKETHLSKQFQDLHWHFENGNNDFKQCKGQVLALMAIWYYTILLVLHVCLSWQSEDVNYEKHHDEAHYNSSSDTVKAYC